MDGRAAIAVLAVDVIRATTASGPSEEPVGTCPWSSDAPSLIALDDGPFEVRDPEVDAEVGGHDGWTHHAPSPLRTRR